MNTDDTQPLPVIRAGGSASVPGTANWLQRWARGYVGQHTAGETSTTPRAYQPRHSADSPPDPQEDQQ